MDDQPQSERIAKWIARAGICSRREAERLIEQGRVTVEGHVATTPATLIDDPKKIAVDGKPLPDIHQARLWCYYKPAGLVTTHRDPEGRPTVFAALPESLPRVVSVGRLDQYSEGLLLLTNDGEFARFLEHPSTGLSREYRVQVYGSIEKLNLKQLAKGITLEEQQYRPIKVEILSQRKLRAWLHFTLFEGKNREIRTILEHFDLKVLKLIRESYGPFTLSDLAVGEVREIPSPKNYFS